MWKTTILLGKIFFLVFISQPLFGSELRMQDGPKIDFIRKDDSGPLHLGLRCTRGLAADTSLRCEVRQKLNGKTLLAAPLEEKKLRAVLDLFFKAVPESEIKNGDGPINANPRSPMQWKVVDGQKQVRGGFNLNRLPPDQAAAVDLFERAILLLETELEAALSESLRAAAAAVGK